MRQQGGKKSAEQFYCAVAFECAACNLPYSAPQNCSTGTTTDLDKCCANGPYFIAPLSPSRSWNDIEARVGEFIDFASCDRCVDDVFNFLNVSDSTVESS